MRWYIRTGARCGKKEATATIHKHVTQRHVSVG